MDGRQKNEIRPLAAEVGVLPRVHGSGLFTRGQTQVLSVCTLDTLSACQKLDTIWEETEKRHMHHYNFPGYSVGEAKPSRSPGRREIGHGALAERALLPVIPPVEEFPYAIRVVSEVLSSTGSPSQGSICGSTLALMDAGVKRTYLLDRPLAAALGVGMDLRQRYGRMIVDMGAGITDIAVISDGEIVQSSSVYYAGDYFDDAIVRYIRKKYSLLIGERTAEQIKINIGTAMKPETDEANLAMPVVGRNQLSGLPRTQEIHAAEIYEALKDPVAALIGSIQDVLVRTPPQLASDIFDDGIVLSGGAAGLARLPEAIYTALHIPCGVADDPQTSVVLGCGIAVEDPGAYASLLDDGRKGFKRL